LLEAQFKTAIIAVKTARSLPLKNNSTRVYYMRQLYLNTWEEAIGKLHHVKVNGSNLRVTLGHFEVMLLLGSGDARKIGNDLERLKGCKVSILRTDLPERPILINVCNGEKDFFKCLAEG
jgi:hypothetical protein